MVAPALQNIINQIKMMARNNTITVEQVQDIINRTLPNADPGIIGALTTMLKSREGIKVIGAEQQQSSIRPAGAIEGVAPEGTIGVNPVMANNPNMRSDLDEELKAELPELVMKAPEMPMPQKPQSSEMPLPPTTPPPSPEPQMEEPPIQQATTSLPPTNRPKMSQEDAMAKIKEVAAKLQSMGGGLGKKATDWQAVPPQFPENTREQLSPDVMVKRRLEDKFGKIGEEENDDTAEHGEMPMGKMTNAPKPGSKEYEEAQKLIESFNSLDIKTRKQVVEEYLAKMAELGVNVQSDLNGLVNNGIHQKINELPYYNSGANFNYQRTPTPSTAPIVRPPVALRK